MRLSRRERQMMDILYQRGSATASEIQEAIPDPPSYSAVRAKLRVLEDKGYISHYYDGPRYVYKPIVARTTAEKSALDHMLQTFYGGSIEKAVAALVQMGSSKMSDDELDRLSELIKKTRREGSES
jgi:predicted transcriptional regulator